MAEKVINTRIINKHGALADWLATGSTILKEGEIGLAYIETTKPDGQGGSYTVPTYLMKVGDGTSTYSELEWVAAPASDVYAWAKKANLALSDIPMADVTENLKGTFYTESEINSKISTINTAIDGKAASSHTHGNITNDGKLGTASRVVVTDSSKNITVSSSITTTELGYLDGVTSNIQTQLGGKAAKATTLAGYGIGDAYTKEEVDAELAKKEGTHTHPYLPDTTKYAGSATQGGAANSVANKITVKLNSGTTEGTNLFTFDGSAAKTINITPSAIGASASGHNHDGTYYTETEIDTKISTLNTAINGKADSDHNHDSKYITPAAVDTKINTALGSVLKYKGTKSSTADLPTSGNNTGDVWNITSASAATETLPKVNAGDNVAWNGTTWDVLAGTVDLSNYYVKSEVNAELAKKSDTGHTHNYAGSSSAGGAANSVKAALTFSTAGDGAANGTTYNGSTARKISYNSVGAAAASHTHTKSEITDFAHNHDDLYYTETEIDSKLAGKSDTGHTHTTSIATSTGTSKITLAHGGKYSITAGGTSYVFTMPSDSNTHYTSKNIVGASSTATTNAEASNGNVYLNHLEESAVKSSHKISGSGATTVSSDASGNITITSTDTNTKVTSVDNHYTPSANSASALSVDASSTTKATWGTTSLVTGVNLQRDAKGHVTGVTVDSIQMPANPDSHYTTKIYAGASGTASNSSANNPYVKIVDNSTYRNQIRLLGANDGTKVSSDANGNVTIEAFPATNAAGETMTYIFDCGGPND